ncbi:hypothetical protein CDCA_CDCA05G1604 [Cyanidium caldarium]|uniref:Target of rapamycin complex subunit LST8 n=1 Tax=Cyanidium caldarium TaxID=2771 RepID=A0AAV9ITV6_CYACA|nr:hypothetical protein CDCA_CDCA05G1604 [Cyanidium caldarium]
MPKKVLLATGGYDHTVRFWEAASGICYRTLQFAESHINRLTFSPDRECLAVGGSQRIVLFDAVGNSPNPVVAFEGHRGNVMSVGYESFGSWLYSGSEDGTVRTWDLRSGKQAHVFHNRAPVTAAVLHANQREIISCDAAGNIRTWDLLANRLNRELKPQGDVSICSAALSSDGALLAVCNHHGNCFVWGVGDKALAATAADVSGDDAQEGGAPQTASDGALEHAAASEPEQAPLDFQPLTTWQPHSRYVLRAVFSPNHKLLATALDSGFIRLWNVSREGGEPWQQNRVLGRHQRWVWDLVFSDNSEFLFSCSSDKRACLWELSSGSVIRTYDAHKLAITAVALSVTSV